MFSDFSGKFALFKIRQRGVSFEDVDDLLFILASGSRSHGDDHVIQCELANSNVEIIHLGASAI